MGERYNEKWHEQIMNADVWSDNKTDKRDVVLRNMAKEFLNSEEVRRRPPEQFNRLVKEIIELLKDRDAEEFSLKDRLRNKRQELYLDIKKDSSSNADKRSLLDKAKNKWKEMSLLREIEEKKLNSWVDYILDYDTVNKNHIKRAEDFEKELKTKPLWTINSLWLANYLILLNQKNQLQSFLKSKLSPENRELIISILYDASNNTYTGSLWFIAQLNKKNELWILKKLSNFALEEMLSDFKHKESAEIIYSKFANEIWVNNKEQFWKELNECRDTAGIFRCLYKYWIKPNESEFVDIFKSIHKEYKWQWVKQEDKLTTSIADLKRINFKEEYTIDSVLSTDKLKKIPSKFHKIKFKDLTEKDWKELDNKSFLWLFNLDMQKVLVVLKEKYQTKKDILKTKAYANDKTAAELWRATLSCVNKDQFDSKIQTCEDIIYEKANINEDLESRLNTIRTIPWFGWIENIYEVINDSKKLEIALLYLNKKENKTPEEKELLIYLLKSKKQDTKTKDLTKVIKNEIKNHNIEQEIQNSLLRVIRTIPWYAWVNHVWDIMYDEKALDRAIKYLSNKKGRTPEESETLNKLQQFRSNLWEINKINKRNPSFNSQETNNTILAMKKQASEHVALNNNFDLWTMSSDRNSRKIFFDALFNYIDSHVNSVKSLKSIWWIEFKIRKDWEWTYKINYWDREMKSLTREQTKDSVSFAIFLEPLWLIDLIPHSSKIIEEINKKSNGKPIKDIDWLNDEEKRLILTKLWLAIIPWYKTQVPEIKEHINQFKNISAINENLHKENLAYRSVNVGNIWELLKLKFPTQNKDWYDIQKLLRAIPS